MSWVKQINFNDYIAMRAYRPDGDTWEHFRDELLALWLDEHHPELFFSGDDPRMTALKQARLLELDDRRSKKSKRVLDTAQKAWSLLSTASDMGDIGPARALAFLDLVPEEGMLKGFKNLEKHKALYGDNGKQGRQARRDALGDARGDATKAMVTALTIFKDLQKAKRAVEECHPAANEIFIENVHPELESRMYAGSQQVGTFITAMEKIIEDLQTMQNGTKPAGGPEKPALNEACTGLKCFFLRSGAKSNRQAEHYTHALLYIAGFWAKSNPKTIEDKFRALKSTGTQSSQ